MRHAISFLLSKNFQLFVKKKWSLVYPDRVIYPDRYLSPAWLSQHGQDNWISMWISFFGKGSFRTPSKVTLGDLFLLGYTVGTGGSKGTLSQGKKKNVWLLSHAEKNSDPLVGNLFLKILFFITELMLDDI